MEKICIVKLRRKIGTPANQEEKGEPQAPQTPEIPPEAPRVADGNQAGAPRPDTGRSVSGATVEGSASVSLTLTPEQTKALRSDRRLMPLLDGDFKHEAKGTDARGEPIVLRFEFEQMPPPRFLKPDEVVQMLRISKSLLNDLVRKGNLKAYRIGRLRRFLLDDILTYMGGDRNHSN